MIGRKHKRIEQEQAVELKSFDDFEVRLGDMMRGERATLGKSLLDVQRELRIKASYIAAIENCDPSAFDTPGFIAGYVRSYARYLGMNPDEAFETFCIESGFSVAHGMSAEASSTRKVNIPDRTRKVERQPFELPGAPFAAAQGGFLSEIDPRAVGSFVVLIALITGLGYGGWSILKEVQQVQVVPVEQSPVVLADIDPLNGIAQGRAPAEDPVNEVMAANLRTSRPAPLAVPVLVPRDGPISSLNPRDVGTLASPNLPEVDRVPSVARVAEAVVPKVVEETAPQLRMVAVRPAWVRVSAADGTVVYEGIMEPGQGYDVPATEEPPVLRVGESGAIYFQLGDQHFGPVGPRGVVTANLSLSQDTITERFALADPQADRDLARMVAEAQTLPSASD